jgi:putative aldouronate transport system substrate-binding protein
MVGKIGNGGWKMFGKGTILKCFAALMAIALLLGGCTTAPTPTSATTASPGAATAASEPEPTPEAPYEVTYYYDGNSAQPDNALVEEAMSKYFKETLKSNTSVKLICLDWGTYPAKLKAMISAGEPFDLCFAAFPWATDSIANINSGAFIAFDPYLDQVPAYKELMGSILELSKMYGKNYLLPCKQEVAASYGLMYNKTLADKYGLDFSQVKTLQDLEPILKKFHENEPTLPAYVAADSSTFEVFNVNLLAYLKDGKYVLGYEQPEFMEAFNLMRKWHEAGYIPDMELTTQSDDYISAGNYLMWCSNLKPGLAEERNPTNQAKGFQIATLELTKPEVANSTLFHCPTALSRTSKDPARAVKAFELWCSDKTLNNLLNFGIEGTHYTKIDADTIKPVENSKYWPACQWELGSRTLDYFLEGESKDLFQQYDAFNASAVPAEDLGFFFNPESVKTQQAAVDAVSSQYTTPVLCGMLDDKAFQQMVDKFKTAGINDIVAEMQKQYDEWKAATGK